MSNATRVWITLIVSVHATLMVAIIVCGAVLGEPTLLITGKERLRQAESETVEAKGAQHVAESELWHLKNPGRD